jgi:hypothetical protein
MNSFEDIERSLRDLRVVPREVTDERILRDASAALRPTPTKRPSTPRGQTEIWRRIMRNNWIKVAASVVVVVGILAALLTILHTAPQPAYAFEQTIEATQGIQWVHTRNVSPPTESPQDIWIEFGADDKVRRVRVEEGRGEAFRVMTWEDGILRFWRPAKKEFLILDEFPAGELMKLRELADPEIVVNRIYEQQEEGLLEIQVDEPKTEGPIIVTATFTEKVKRPYRVVLQVDPETKLATQKDRYKMVDGEYQLVERGQFLEYNEPIAPEMFFIEPPADVEVVDRTTGIGMSQGDLTDAQAAAEVVRQYLQALIQKDYSKATRLYGYRGRGPERLRELKIRYIRIVSIGAAQPVEGLVPRMYRVPFAVEIEKADGTRVIEGPPVESGPGPRSQRTVRVRPASGQPDRWVIHGGI